MGAGSSIKAKVVVAEEEEGIVASLPSAKPITKLPVEEIIR